MRIAVVGRPNAGKSTLINRILGEERLLTGPEAGITRDAIAVPVTWDGTPMRIFDTAGMRKKAKVQEKLEKLSVADGLRAVKFAEVVVVLLDAAIPFETQDLRIADLAEREGRAVVVAVNKWDLEAEKQDKLRALRTGFETLLPQLKGAPLVTVSAATGKGLDRLQAAILQAHDTWNRRVPTAALNRWLAAMTEAHPPPAPGGRRIKLRYMTQAKTRPPGFVVMCSHPDKVPASYTRYLGERAARGFRHAGHTDPALATLAGGQESVQEPQEIHALAPVQARALGRHEKGLSVAAGPTRRGVLRVAALMAVAGLIVARPWTGWGTRDLAYEDIPDLPPLRRLATQAAAPSGTATDALFLRPRGAR